MRTLLLFITSAVLISCQPTANEKYSEFKKINTEVLAYSEAFTTLEHVTSSIGHRLTGSLNGKAAEEFTYNKFKEYGFEDVTFQDFEVEAWSRGTLSLNISSGDSNLSMPAVSLGHSPIKDSVTAPLVYLGNGLAKDYEEIGDKLEGKIALVYIGLLAGTNNGVHNLHRSEKASLAIANGAAGVIIYNQVENGVLLTGTASVSGSLLPVPAICIGLEDGEDLKEKLDKGELEATIVMTNHSNKIKARNVIATLPGSDLSSEKIILGGHLDSWDLATGAIDNGIGAFAVLDIARTFIKNGIKPKRTLQFVMFMGEEQGLLGSTYMVEQAIQDGSINDIKFMMNLDMTGNPIGINVSGTEIDSAHFKNSGSAINTIDTTYSDTFSVSAGLHSDHQPFMLEGIPILSMHSNLDRSVYNCYHADCDDFDLVNEEHIRNTVRFGTMQLLALANADKLPAKRMTSDETKEFMINNHLKEKLILQGDWKWEQ